MKLLSLLNRVDTPNFFLTGLIILLNLSPNASLQAQIIPDTTLPFDSLVSPNGNTLAIEGGTQVGGNLFHSFADFSLPTGLEAYFNNALTINNIISRVTGSTVSNINGLIKANGSANLFLLNPNGIIFGPNASLNIGGSFLASTANSIHFEDGSEFSATNPSASPLLTVTMPIGLQFRQNSSAIRVQGAGHNLALTEPIVFFTIKQGDSQTGLRVKPGNTLALVGGSIDIEGGTLTAEDGRIELGSLQSGLVSLNPTSVGWTLGYEGIKSFQDIRLSQRALVDASGVNSGSIQVQGARVSLRDGSVIWIENRGSRPSGDIQVHALKSLELSGLNGNLTTIFPSLVFTQAVNTGKGGDIAISTQQLVLEELSIIDALTVIGGARGGNISVQASDSVNIIGKSPLIGNGIITRTQFSGDAGNIVVSTNKVTLLNGANILSGSNIGRGNAGDVKVNASEIEISGVIPQNFLPSVIGSPSAGGDAGNVEINTSRLILRNGGQISTSIGSNSNAGDVTINASELVEVNGTVPGSINPTQIISSVNILDEVLRQRFGLPPVPSGNSGNVTINTPRLIVTDGAQVTVRNDGTGSAGTLLINADSLFLDNQGGITASTVSGNGGNITLNVQDTLLLRNNSFISATAGGTGNGGNIDINTNFLIASFNENSDITANAFGGQGGAINITANRGVLGLSIRDELTPNNDITAFSQLEPALNGIITLNTPEIDPSRGLIELPQTVINPNTLIAQNPCKKGTDSELTVTGRGGLPPNPTEDLNPEATQVDLVEPASTVETEGQQKDSSNSSPLPTSIVPAQGWVFNDRGEVVLIAYNPNVTESQRLQTPPVGCPTP